MNHGQILKVALKSVIINKPREPTRSVLWSTVSFLSCWNVCYGIASRFIHYFNNVVIQVTLLPSEVMINCFVLGQELGMVSSGQLKLPLCAKKEIMRTQEWKPTLQTLIIAGTEQLTKSNTKGLETTWAFS